MIFFTLVVSFVYLPSPNPCSLQMIAFNIEKQQYLLSCLFLNRPTIASLGYFQCRRWAQAPWQTDLESGPRQSSVIPKFIVVLLYYSTALNLVHRSFNTSRCVSEQRQTANQVAATLQFNKRSEIFRAKRRIRYYHSLAI